MEKKLIWLDLEMTGLDPNAERIIEIFTAVSNEDLTEIIDGPNLVVSQPQEYIDAVKYFKCDACALTYRMRREVLAASRSL